MDPEQWQEDLDDERWAADLRRRLMPALAEQLDVPARLEETLAAAGSAEPRAHTSEPAHPLPPETQGALAISVQHRQDVLVGVVSGQADIYTSLTLRRFLINAINAGWRDLVLDLDALEFLDSNALSVLLGGLKRTRTVRGRLVLVCAQERVLKIFRLTGLNNDFEIFDALDEAVASLHRDR